METSLNVTDYPEPKEQNCYVFECDCSCKGRFYVYADTPMQAKERFDSKDYDDTELYDFEIVGIEAFIDGN